MFDLPLYLYPMIGYVVIYVVVYALPVIRRIATTGFMRDTKTLGKRIHTELEKERERAWSDRVATESPSISEEGVGASDEELSASFQSAFDAVDSGEEDPISEEEATASKAKEEKADRAGPEEAIRPEFLSRTLESSFANDFVQQAVQQLRTHYPHGNFRSFEIERLPAYAMYDERLTAARNMAGLFVLFGLLGTMIKLNDIVQQIGDAAATGSQTVEASSFLNNMGAIMANIGGAFESSIWGLALMVIALVVIGLADRVMQRRLDALDATVQQQVIPRLATLQLLRTPNLSMGDLIEETSSLLTDLNGTVDGLTDGMQESLSQLSGRIEDMMEDFGSFQSQYAKLNDLIEALKKHAGNVDDVTDALRGAARTLQNPISDMNRNLNHTIREHMGVVGEAIQTSEKNRDELAREFQTMQAEMKGVLSSVEEIVQDNIDQSDKQHEEVVENVQKQIALIEKRSQQIDESVENQIALMQEQSKVVETQMDKTAEALERANSQQLTKVLENLDDNMGNASGNLEKSASHLEAATEGMQRREESPVTLFEWGRRFVEKKTNGDR